jgi:hypothetical protein
LGIICDFWMSLREFLDPVMNSFIWQTFSTVKSKHFFMSILCIESLCPLKKHNRMLLFGSTILKQGRHFDYWNQPLNMCICYLDCHEAGLCYYLVIQIENISCPLQSVYFHLCPIFTDSPSYIHYSYAREIHSDKCCVKHVIKLWSCTQFRSWD